MIYEIIFQIPGIHRKWMSGFERDDLELSKFAGDVNDIDAISHLTCQK
jgi:hypothetical protein